jgi:hypothetical protein
MDNFLQNILVELLILGTVGASLYGYSVCRRNTYRNIFENSEKDCLPNELQKLVEKYLPDCSRKSPTFP